MTIKQLIKELCKREGKKKQINIAQMSETVGCLAELFCHLSDDEVAMTVNNLFKLGDARLKKAEKAKAKKK